MSCIMVSSSVSLPTPTLNIRPIPCEVSSTLSRHAKRFRRTHQIRYPTSSLLAEKLILWSPIIAMVLLQISGTLCHDDAVFELIPLVGNEYWRPAFSTKMSMHYHARICVAVVIRSDVVAAAGDIKLLSGRVMSTIDASKLREGSGWRLTFF